MYVRMYVCTKVVCFCSTVTEEREEAMLILRIRTIDRYTKDKLDTRTKYGWEYTIYNANPAININFKRNERHEDLRTDSA